MIDSWGISYEIAQRHISVEPTDDRSTLVQVIACCHQQQAVIRANVNTDLCHHMASLGHNVLKLKIILEDHFIILCINHWLSWYTDYKQPLSHAIECGRFWSQIMDCVRKKILDALQVAQQQCCPATPVIFQSTWLDYFKTRPRRFKSSRDMRDLTQTWDVLHHVQLSE